MTGKVNDQVYEDNTKAWSGDHCIDPELVPGVFFSNYPINTTDPSIVDIAPSVLSLYNVEIPGQMDGRPLFDAASFGSDSRRPEAASRDAGAVEDKI